MPSSGETRKRRLLYVANEDFAFLLNRLRWRARRARPVSRFTASPGEVPKDVDSGSFI
jgi:hypothetical protein